MKRSAPNPKNIIPGGWAHRSLKFPYSKWVTFSPCIIMYVGESYDDFATIIARVIIDDITIRILFSILRHDPLIAHLKRSTPGGGTIEDLRAIVHGRILGSVPLPDDVADLLLALDEDDEPPIMVLGSVDVEVIR